MMPKSEMGWVLQYMTDRGFCRDPLHRLGWELGAVGLPVHFPGKEIEYEPSQKVTVGLGSPLPEMRGASPPGKR
jgi:hypothetical protein